MSKKTTTEQAPLFAGLDLNEIHLVETVTDEQAEKYQFETVDFADPNRPKTCLEVDFPILKVNEISAIEQNATKPIYMMSKWWARRRSSVFRQLLISAATKAPADESKAAQTSWSLMYRKNHQKHGKFSNLKVVDIFMGGGTTVVEAARLGFDIQAIDLNPIAWWVVKNETTPVPSERIKQFASYIESQVKPQIMPFYTAVSPRGFNGKWLNKNSNQPASVSPETLEVKDRENYIWEGPEVVCTFWMKHSMCTDPSCNHLTPTVSTTVVAEKDFSVKYLENCVCPHCGDVFDLEYGDFRMAPSSKLIVGEEEQKFAVLENGKETSKCPHCSKKLDVVWISEQKKKKGKPKSKKIGHCLVLDKTWFKGITAKSKNQYGGYPTASLKQDEDWYRDRLIGLKFLEFRGKPEDKFILSNTSEKKGSFICGKCGRLDEVSNSSKLQGHVASFFPYVIQGFDPVAKEKKYPYGGRFFDVPDVEKIIAAQKEFITRNDVDAYVPKDELWFGHQTHQRDNLPGHGYKYWTDMFNKRQLYTNALLLKTIIDAPDNNFSNAEKSQLLGAWQNYLRHNCMMTIWNPQRDTMEPHFANNNYHPKTTTVENGVFANLGRGNFTSCVGNVFDGMKFLEEPYDLQVNTAADGGKSVKIESKDKITKSANLYCQSSTDLKNIIENSSVDLVITDPPFGDNVQYAELSDFFLVWLSNPLKKIHPHLNQSCQAPKTLEAVANKARQPGKSESGSNKADDMYDRLLTLCWKEAHRILKPAGIMAFTFHHDKDDAWINVLESLFKAGFIIESAFPIRSDATKGDGDFGSKKIEYDIVHVCKKRPDSTPEIYWATLRKKIIESVKSRSFLLAQHKQSGLHLADLEVIIRGEVLEQYSAYYGKVKKNIDGDLVTVREILIEANYIAQALLQSAEHEKVPDAAEPETKIYFSLFRDAPSIEFNAARKRLKGSGASLEELESYGWVTTGKAGKEKVSSVSNIGERWNSLARKKSFSSDLDQVHFAINCCLGGKQFDGKPADLESWIGTHYKSLLPSVVPILKYMEGNHFGTEYKVAIGMAYRTIERTLNMIKETDGEYKKASDQLSLFE